MANDKIQALHVQVAEKLIQQLKDGTAPWQKPWSIENTPAFELPYNALTGNRYKGINIFSLLTAGYDDPRWVTFKQAAANEWNVKKGEKASLIQFVKTTDLVAKRDENGKPLLNAEGKQIRIPIKLDRPIITTAWVFNAAQVNGIPSLLKEGANELEWNPIERAEKLIAGSGASIDHKAGDSAYYSPSRDKITIPLKEQFDAPDKYYATLLHELGHWTGHKDRLDRSIINKFGTQRYAREELRAEIASLLIGQELRIGHDPGQHTAYVGDWIKLLQDTPFEIHAAAADAEKIFNYLTGLEQKREIERIEEPLTENKPRNKGAGSEYLSLGDEISYNGAHYKVQGHLKQGRLRMEELESGKSFILSKNDGLYGSLLNVKLGLAHTQKTATDNSLTVIASERQELAAHTQRR
ncbi:ArdC family protein [Pedobacter sp. Hv1]|uniref:ArdC family protein n=1 Tax=Pedobacter sp. Hv1 TaxID=1740090 RepID=UPI0006D8BF31|nr:zincin-like metallopeptidase domain-containing protein [Pedobacter sp. Hv1]KQB99856.1 conjugal transfer protein TraC [Pedobacter sp. Hv1]